MIVAGVLGTESANKEGFAVKPSVAFAGGLGTESENIDSLGGRKSFDRVEPVFIGLMLKSSNRNPNPKTARHSLASPEA